MREWITVAEAARLACVTERTIRDWVRKGAVEKTKPNPSARRVLVRREHVDPGGGERK